MCVGEEGSIVDMGKNGMRATRERGLGVSRMTGEVGEQHVTKETPPHRDLQETCRPE